jgi:uncharacterized membrane protein YqjE
MDDHPPTPSFLSLGRRIARTGLGLLQNRAELLFLELQEEKGRAILLIVGAVGLLFASMMTLLLITGTVIFLVPEGARAYTAGGFALLYFLGALFAFFAIKHQLKRAPFIQTLAELRKDRTALDSFE